MLDGFLNRKKKNRSKSQELLSAYIDEELSARQQARLEKELLSLSPADAKEIAAYYTRANKSQVTELLETLAAVGNIRQLDDGRFTVFQ